jgi:hypothetical protein
MIVKLQRRGKVAHDFSGGLSNDNHSTHLLMLSGSLLRSVRVIILLDPVNERR